MISESHALRRAVRIVGKTCFYCGGKSDHADHVLSTKNGGKEHAENFVAACASCNCRKGHRHLRYDWLNKALISAFINAPEVERMTSIIIDRQNNPSFANTKEFMFIYSLTQ